MWPSFPQRSRTFFRPASGDATLDDPATASAPDTDPAPLGLADPPSDPLLLPSPTRWTALLSYAALVFFSAFLALFMAEATDPVRGFLPVVLDPPPAHSAPRGFEAAFGVSRLYARSALETPLPLVANSGEYYRYPPQQGLASWYGYDHIGRKTADGGWFDPEALTAAHRTLPFGSLVRVTRLSTGRTVEVSINDRGPFIEGRVIDLSRRAATELGMREHGVARVRVEVLRYPFGGPMPAPAAPVPPVAASPAVPPVPREPRADPVSVSTSVSAAARRAAEARAPLKKADPALKALVDEPATDPYEALALPLPPPVAAP